MAINAAGDSPKRCPGQVGKAGAMCRADSTALSADGARAQAIIQGVMGELHPVSRALVDTGFEGTRRRKSFN
jgi:hypothetical protein